MASQHFDFETEPRNPFFEAWAQRVVQFRWIILLTSLALLVAAPLVSKDRLIIDTSVESFSVKNSGAQSTLDEYRQEFGKDEMFLVVVSGDVFSMPYLNRLKGLHDELAALDLDLESLGYRNLEFVRLKREQALGKAKSQAPSAGPSETAADDFEDDDDFDDEEEEDAWGDEEGGTIVEKITSLINVRQTRMIDGVLEIGELMTPFPTAEMLPALKERILENRTLVNQVVSAGGDHSVIMIRTQFMSDEDSKTLYEAVLAIAKKHETDGFSTTVAGLTSTSRGTERCDAGRFTYHAHGVGLYHVFVVGLLVPQPHCSHRSTRSRRRIGGDHRCLHGTWWGYDDHVDQHLASVSLCRRCGSFDSPHLRLPRWSGQRDGIEKCLSFSPWRPPAYRFFIPP